MLKMFSTQLTGLFGRVQANEEFAMEDAARLLAQAVAGEGKIYIKGFAEMESVELEATKGQEPMRGAYTIDMYEEITEADRVLVVSRFSNDAGAIILAKKLVRRGISFVAISGGVKQRVEGEEDLRDLADVHVDTKLLKGMLPGELGARFGFPGSMAALFAYHGMKFVFDEILTEYFEEEEL
ncbi:DUF2529 family protein [Bacillus coahuilensis]|uniref:DUF2529 family protein n=1 Tax=Bacillus coahuilensis TaxID=408580 RepID=UPI00018512B4|nr:DUF2529 family protein [Bacillus coahuilensis]